MNEKQEQYKKELLEKIGHSHIDADIYLVPRKFGMFDAFYVIVNVQNSPKRQFTTVVPMKTENWTKAQNNVLRHILDICKEIERCQR